MYITLNLFDFNYGDSVLFVDRELFIYVTQIVIVKC